jgi:hypothetical protein
MKNQTLSVKDIAKVYFNGLAENVIKEGVENEVLTSNLKDEEYNYLEEKILGYVEKHFNYAVVRNITQHIPTIATAVAAVLRVSTKATIVTAVASTLLEVIIRAVVAYYMLPVKEAFNVEGIDIDDEDDLFGDSFEDLEDDEEFNFEEVENIVEETIDEEEQGMDTVVEEAVETVVEKAMSNVSEEGIGTCEATEEENAEMETGALINNGTDEDRENLGEPV